MNRGPFIVLGVFVVLSLSWAFALLKPIREHGALAPLVAGGQRQPSLIGGLAAQGRDVYVELGCIACHTQQVRYPSGKDVARGWGDRQTVPQDYIDQSPVLLGRSRVGPDLTNVGARRAERDWHLQHFYNPRTVTQGSNMPAYPFLFETRKIVGQRSHQALDLPAEFAPPESYEVVPTRKAEALAAYMLSLRIDYDLKEAPSPEKLAQK